MTNSPVLLPDGTPAGDMGLSTEATKACELTLDVNTRDLEILKQAETAFKANPQTLQPLLPMLLLNGKPFNIDNHFPFEPFYKIQIPKKVIWKCARQVSKSTSLAASGVLRCISTPHLRMLFITPRFEQIRRLSTNYIRPFITGSPIVQRLALDESCVQAVLQRSFASGSTMYFSFAFLDCDRVRGISAGWVNYDEVQDLDYDFIPIIHECTSAQDMVVAIYSGTPKTLDNGIEALWQDSSKAEWVIPCYSCGYWNMACVDADLMKMMGKDTVVCAKCDKPINPRLGRWYHRDKDKNDFHGYHVPQVIMPMHYANSEKWGELLGKREGKGGYSKQKFLNEVLGESADVGVKLITQTDIQTASVLGSNEFRKAVDRIRKMEFRVMGVDWGGGGVDEISYTSIAISGYNRVTGRVECHYAERCHFGMTHDEEAAYLLQLFKECNCDLFCHDYGGSGSVRETLMIQSGLPMDRIMGFMYCHATTRDIVSYVQPYRGELRGYWALDKARSLVLQAVSLKGGAIFLPEYNSSKSVTHDLLNLMEQKNESRMGADVYLIQRVPKQSDDFAHALNFSCFGIWHAKRVYPDLSLLKKIRLSEKQLATINPSNPKF